MEQEEQAQHHDHQHHDHQHGAEHVHTHKASLEPFPIVNNRLVFAVIVIAILSITVYARLGLAHDQGLFEPDGFFYYSVVRATINNHLSEPQHLGISGFPGHNFIGEAPGLPYLTVIFYLLLGWTGASALDIMRMLPILVGLIEVVLAYLLAKELSNSRLCGLLAMFFVAVSAGNIARTAALVYRGDTFIAVPLMIALLIMLKGLKLQSARRGAIYALVAAFILSTGILVWNGSPYIIVVYMFSLALLTIYSFISWKPGLARSALIFTAALFAVYLLQSIYLSLHAARTGLALDGSSFLAFYIPVLVGTILVYWVIGRGRVGVLHSPSGRAAVAAIVALAMLAVVGALFSGYVRTITNASGVTQPGTANATNTANETGISYAIGSTTQELQKPSFQFLFASFGLEMYLMPIGIIMFLLLNRRIDGRDEEGNQIVTAAFIALFVYLAVTAYLQYNAIRYNSLLSIPLALFAAYALYGAVRLYRGHEEWAKRFAPLTFILGIAVCLAYLAFILAKGGLASGNPIWLLEAVAAALVAVFLALDTAMRHLRGQHAGRLAFALSAALLFGYLAIRVYQTLSAGLNANFAALVVEGILTAVVTVWIIIDTAIAIRKREVGLRRIAIAIVAVVVIFSFFLTVIESYGSSQADGINPSFLSAMSWLKSNTASNATVLALWPDGSVVEGWGNRTSYMDSVGGENGVRIYYFARYLVNNTPDSKYLYGIGKPQYLVARQYWLTELAGLIAEGVPQNPENYTFTVLGSTRQPQSNATAMLYFFGNGAYNVTLVNRRVANSTAANYSAYLGQVGQDRLYRISRVTLYNTTSARYTEFNASPGSYQINYTLMLFYSGTSIQGAIVTTDGLYDSNLFRLVWLCNPSQCPYYSNSTARLTPVYANNDTRIYRITYT